jgi:hypothetical protein
MTKFPNPKEIPNDQDPIPKPKLACGPLFSRTVARLLGIWSLVNWDLIGIWDLGHWDSWRGFMRGEVRQ